MKFLVLSLLVVAATALPSSYNFGSSSYSSTPIQYGSQYVSGPRVSSGYGLSSGFLGNGFNYQQRSAGQWLAQPSYQASYAAAPAAQIAYVQAAAPAVSYVQAAPAYQTVALQAAPVAQIAVQSAPSVAFQSSYQAQPAIQSQNYAATASAVQHRSDNFQSVVPAAINQISRTVEYRDVNNIEQPAQAQVVEIEPSDNPVHLHFKTRSSSLSVSQTHTPAEAQEVQSASAQDEPQRLITEVTKPVIQEVRETITPFRQVTQEIHPVQESLHAIVSKGEVRQQHQYTAQRQNYAQGHTQNYAQGYSQNYVQAAPSVQTIAVQSAPVAVQSYAVQAAPVQTVAVQAQPVAVAQIASPVQYQTLSAPASYQTISGPASSGYSTGYTARYGSQYSAGPSARSSSSSWNVSPSAHSTTSYAHKQVSIEKPTIVSSSTTTRY